MILMSRTFCAVSWSGEMKELTLAPGDASISAPQQTVRLVSGKRLEICSQIQWTRIRLAMAL
jgi:hypothetical protein